MEMIVLCLVVSIVRIAVQAALAYSAIRRFNTVKLGCSGFFIEANGRKK